MREYRIIRSDMWWNISRKKEMWRLMLLQYLNWKGLWTPNKWLSKTFYKREDAERTLKVIEKQDEWKKSD